MKITTTQEEILLKEAGLASSSLEYGLTILRKAELTRKAEYYQAFFQLSIGLERLMKIIIIENYLGVEKKFPSNSILKGYGHKLVNLFDATSKLQTGQYIDPRLNDISNSILNLLSEFAISTRYYNLDVLTQGKTKSKDPLVVWKQIQDKIRGVHKKRITKKDIYGFELAQIVDNKSITRIFDESNNILSKYSEFYRNVYDTDFIQGHATVYTLDLICYLVNILSDVEEEYNLYPYLREFFWYLTGNWGNSSQKRRKRNWINK